MPVLIAPWIGLLFGVFFAWSAREELARSERGPLASAALVLPVAFGFLMQGPVAGYFLAVAPDWSMAYLIDSQRVPPVVDFVAVLLTAATPVCGYALAAPAASRREGVPLLRWSLPLLIVVIGVTAALLPRLSTEASYTQFRGSFGTRRVAGGSLGIALLWMNALLFCSAGWTAKSLRQFGQRARD
ncbi:MAG TPA: hypothetical protein VKP30_30500 [Polyangiaceae bacterium]|nr:hypothetical protein [Polyangiaceae bacterium]